jgi:hypothetical protein
LPGRAQCRREVGLGILTVGLYPEQCAIQIACDPHKGRKSQRIRDVQVCIMLRYGPTAGISANSEDDVPAFRVSRQRVQREETYQQQCRMETHGRMVRSAQEYAPRALSQ